jgi:hypothetical protein
VATLTQGATVITLSDDFEFPEEFTWRSVEQTKSYSVTGALMVEAGVKQTGREITLQGGDTFAWVTREQVEDLQTLAQNFDTDMTLVFRGVTYTVRFDHSRGAIDARPVADFQDPQPTDFFIVTLRFYEI